jgi:hypothetical protein
VRQEREDVLVQRRVPDEARQHAQTARVQLQQRDAIRGLAADEVRLPLDVEADGQRLRVVVV